MLYFIAASILIRCIALAWSVVMWVRLRDLRMGWLTALMMYLLGRQVFTTVDFLKRGRPPTALEAAAEILAMGTSLICLGILWGLGRMIHDREVAAEALRRSEQTQRALLDANPDAMFRMRRDGTYLGYKARDDSRLLVPPERFMGRKVTEVLDEPMAGRCLRAIHAALDTGQIQTYEYEYSRSGLTRYWEVRVSVCAPDEALVLVRNVTDRKRMEQDLLQTTEDLERAQAISQTGSWVSDPDAAGRLEWSAQTCRIFGIEPAAFDHRVETFFSHVHPDDRAAVRLAAGASLGEDVPYDVEHRIVRADGRIRWVHQQAGVVRDAAGKPVRMIGVIHDITDQRLAEESLAQSERRYRNLFDLNPQPMWVYERKTLRFLAVNKASIRRYGYSEDEFLAMTLRDIRPPEEVPDLERRLAFEARPSLRGVFRHRCKDGTLLDVQITASPTEFQGLDAEMVVAVDLTEQRRAEEALRQSEERYRRLAEHGAVGIWEVDTDGRTIYANPLMCAMLEVPSADALRGVSFRTFLTEESLRVMDRELVRRRRGEASTYQVEILGRRGGRRIAIVSGAPMMDAQARLTSLIGTFTDVTELKQTEERLRFAESRYRTIFEQSPDGIMLVDPQTARPVQANSALLEILGYSEQEFLELSLFEIEAAEDRDEVRAHIARVLEAGHDAFETRLRTKSGRVIDTAMRIRVLELGGARRFQTIVRDITQQKLDEERLRAAEQRNAALIRQTPLGVIVWDLSRRVVEWNPTAERIFGYTFDQAVGRTFDELIVPERVRPATDRIWADLLSQTGGVRSTNENRTSAGRRIVCEWYNSPLVDADGRVMAIASLVQDVTDIKRLEEQLRQAQKMEAVGRLASGVAHDFSSLLTAISGFTSLARRTLSPNHPAVRSLDRVDDAARQAVGVTKSLLTFSRGGGGAPKGPVDLARAVEDAVRILRRSLPANVSLRVRDNVPDAYVHGDTTQLQQIIVNLAINARDAMP